MLILPSLLGVGEDTQDIGNDVYVSAYWPFSSDKTNQALFNSTALTDYGTPVTSIDTTNQRFGAGCLSFPGSSGLYQSSTPAYYALSTYAFTIDFWVRPGATGALQYLLDYRANAENTNLSIRISAANHFEVTASAATKATSTTTIAADTWYHVALVRTGGTSTLYINGVSEATFSDSQNYGAPTNRPVLGYNSSAGGNWFTGKLQNIRISRGVARWTASFSPPTGTYGIKTFSPNPGIDTYTKFYPRISLPHGAAIGLVDMSSLGNTISGSGALADGDTAGCDYGCVLFTAASSYYRVNDATNTALGSGDFTVDGWVKDNGTTANYFVADWRPVGSSGPNPFLYGHSGILTWGGGTGGAVIVDSTTAIDDGNWHHVAVVRYSGTTKIYIDGVEEDSASDSINYASTTNRPMWGGAGFQASSYGFNGGRMQGWRISKGIARWTSNFSVPVGPYT